MGFQKLQRKLDRPRTNGAGGGNHSCCRQRRLARRITREGLAEDIVHGKVRVIENIEELPAKLQDSAVAQLLDGYIFSKREIQIEVAGSGQNLGGPDRFRRNRCGVCDDQLRFVVDSLHVIRNR